MIRQTIKQQVENIIIEYLGIEKLSDSENFPLYNQILTKVENADSLINVLRDDLEEKDAFILKLQGFIEDQYK